MICIYRLPLVLNWCRFVLVILVWVLWKPVLVWHELQHILLSTKWTSPICHMENQAAYPPMVTLSVCLLKKWFQSLDVSLLPVQAMMDLATALLVHLPACLQVSSLWELMSNMLKWKPNTLYSSLLAKSHTLGLLVVLALMVIKALIFMHQEVPSQAFLYTVFTSWIWRMAPVCQGKENICFIKDSRADALFLAPMLVDVSLYLFPL